MLHCCQLLQERRANIALGDGQVAGISYAGSENGHGNSTSALQCYLKNVQEEKVEASLSIPIGIFKNYEQEIAIWNSSLTQNKI